MTYAPVSSGRRPASAPLKARPMGVRIASTITASGMNSFSHEFVLLRWLNRGRMSLPDARRRSVAGAGAGVGKGASGPAHEPPVVAAVAQPEVEHAPGGV